MEIQIRSNFINNLPSDPLTDLNSRQVVASCYSFVTPKIPKNPKLIHVNPEMLNLLGISKSQGNSIAFLDIFSGKKIYPNTKPFSLNYAGHQFGNWAGQLGDGRAMVLFEAETTDKKTVMLQLKGAGKTPYSRRGDGLAVLRSSIREHLCSEAMHYLGVPTTRSLSLLETGDDVLRDILYNGNPALEKGAIVCRVAPSFLRFGSFELHASRNEISLLKKLASFAIKNYFPDIKSKGKEAYLELFNTIATATKELIIQWQRVGFVHGVMNTDNMSIHGITIDYGPYGWLENYDLNWTPNTTDSQHHRYAFGNQPEVALWNLYQLANALYPLVEEAKPFEAILEAYQKDFERDFTFMMNTKLGIYNQKNTDELILSLQDLLKNSDIDYTLFFRNLSKINQDSTPTDALTQVKDAFYSFNILNDDQIGKWHDWFIYYTSILAKEKIAPQDRVGRMNETNPKYVLRNYMAQMAIDKANEEDYSLIYELFELLKYPYAEQSDNEKWFAKRPDWAKTKVGCSMLSCSS